MPMPPTLPATALLALPGAAVGSRPRPMLGAGGRVMTRIALLPSAYPPAVGGVEELTRHLALALVDAGDEVEVWTLHGDDARPETVEVRDDLIVRRFPMPLPGGQVVVDLPLGHHRAPHPVLVAECHRRLPSRPPPRGLLRTQRGLRHRWCHGSPGCPWSSPCRGRR